MGVAHCKCPGLPLVGLDGFCRACRPPDDVPLAGEPTVVRHVDPDLPSWCRGVGYRADDDIVTVTAAIPTDRGEVLVAFESTPLDASALARALTRCVEQSHRSVLDAESTETPAPAPPSSTARRRR